MNIAQSSAGGEPEEPSQRKSFFGRFFKKATSSPILNVSVPKTDQFAQNLSEMTDTLISDIATPRADIVALPVDCDMDVFFETLRTHGYSRVPVYNETLDDPVGLVHVKDIFMTYGLDVDPERFSLEPFVRPLIFVPPSLRVLTLLQKMQTERMHMAVVIDEYGGVDGLLTIEDIIEEIVGEITDEHDDTEDLWTQEKPGVYLAKAWAPIDDFEEAVGAQLPKDIDEDDVDTLGGLIITLATRVPSKGEVIRDESGFEFEIVEADPRRLKTVRVRLPLKAFEGIE